MGTLYFDYNATAPVDPEVLAAMVPYLGRAGNPSSRHALGRQARRAIDQAREQIAHALDAHGAQIFFTSGASEANNLAIHSASGAGGSHALVSLAEHPSVLEPVRALRQRGFDVEELSLDENGRVLALPDRVRSDTSLVAVQLANSETGVLGDVASLAARVAKRTWFHGDAVQAVGRIPVRFHELGVSSMTIAGHKLQGPPGIGALIVRSGWACRPLQLGGLQQQGIRPGTEPVGLIVGLGKAVALAVERMSAYREHVGACRDQFERMALDAIPDVVRNPEQGERLPNTSNLSFLGAKSEPLLIALDLAGVCCSAGTACASGAIEPSPVLRAMGLSAKRVESALRFSFGWPTTSHEIDEGVARLATIVARVRGQFSATGGSSDPGIAR